MTKILATLTMIGALTSVGALQAPAYADQPGRQAATIVSGSDVGLQEGRSVSSTAVSIGPDASSTGGSLGDAADTGR